MMWNPQQGYRGRDTVQGYSRTHFWNDCPPRMHWTPSFYPYEGVRYQQQQQQQQQAYFYQQQQQHLLQQQHRMASILDPHENDVLMGRGGKNNQHSGNEKLREMAREYCETYRSSSKKAKSNLSRLLVQQMQQLDPPARFLKKDTDTGHWVMVGDDTAREKASQVLRDAVAIHASTPERVASSLVAAAAAAASVTPSLRTSSATAGTTLESPRKRRRYSLRSTGTIEEEEIPVYSSYYPSYPTHHPPSPQQQQQQQRYPRRRQSTRGMQQQQQQQSITNLDEIDLLRGDLLASDVEDEGNLEDATAHDVFS